jgi:hypothetical protein
VASGLTSEELRRLARMGAARRLEELRREEAALRAAFPGLGSIGAERGRRQAQAANNTTARRRRRRKMSAAQKRAVSVRMKKYWAERRKAR